MIVSIYDMVISAKISKYAQVMMMLGAINKLQLVLKKKKSLKLLTGLRSFLINTQIFVAINVTYVKIKDYDICQLKINFQ